MVAHDSESHHSMMPLVLLVEDHVDTCLLFARILSHAGYRVHTAVDGQEALVSLAHDPPQLVIVDLWLPTLDGVTLITLVRKREDTLPILAISANAPPTELPEIPFLRKPFTIACFLDSVTRLLPSLASRSAPSNLTSGRS